MYCYLIVLSALELTSDSSACCIIKPGTHWQQSRKDIQHSGDKNYSLSTKSTKLNIFIFGDSVDRNMVNRVEWAGNSGQSPKPATNRWQSRKYLRHIGNKVDGWLCRQYVPGSKLPAEISEWFLGFLISLPERMWNESGCWWWWWWWWQHQHFYHPCSDDWLALAV